MSRQSFWSEDAKRALVDAGRQDLVDRGDAFAERVTALVLMSIGRLERYAEYGELYSGHGGETSLESESPIQDIENFVNVRLPEEISALEHLLSTFDDLRFPPSARPTHVQSDNFDTIIKPMRLVNR